MVLCQYYRDEPSLDNSDYAVGISGTNHDSKPFKYKQKIRRKTDANGRKNAKKMVPLKYLSLFWTPFQMPLVIMKLK